MRKPSSGSPDGCVAVPRLGPHLVLCLGQQWPLTPLLGPLLHLHSACCHPTPEPRSLSPKIHSTIFKYPKFNTFVLLLIQGLEQTPCDSLPLLLPVFLASELLPGQEQVTQCSGTVLPGQFFQTAMSCSCSLLSHRKLFSPRLTPACAGRAGGGSTRVSRHFQEESDSGE